MTDEEFAASYAPRNVIRDPAPEEWPHIRKRQLEFLEAYGDFEGTIFNNFWVGTSPDGRYTGFYFKRDDGTEIRVAMGSEMMALLVQSICIATRIAAERAKLALQTAGSA
jgi:hypothetical protein